MREKIAEFAEDLVWFGMKEALSCLFAASFFIILFLSSKFGIPHVPRYDLIFLGAVALQLILVLTGIETWDEVKTISLFHVLGFVLEVFKTHPSIGSWSYPEEGYLKVAGVPLYSGFMYAAVASYMIQAWRFLDLKIEKFPSYWRSVPLALAIYLNFFTHHFIWDIRWPLAALTVYIFRNCSVTYRPKKRLHKMPLWVSFFLIGFFVWVAENIATYFKAWSYPDQQKVWTVVHWGKISSWSLLVIMSFIIVADLKHYKESLKAAS